MLFLYYFLPLLPLISFIFGFISFILLCNFVCNLFPCYYPLVVCFIPLTIFLFHISLVSSFVSTILFLLFSIYFCFSSSVFFSLSFAVIIQSFLLYSVCPSCTKFCRNVFIVLHKPKYT